MHKTVVLNVVGLTPSLIGEHTPHLRAFRDAGGLATVDAALPAVTCTAQADYLTGTRASEHGVVANGWLHRDSQEIRFWQQTDGLVHRPRLWETAKERDASFTCANLFWWFAMYSRADYTVTPRPMYPADGRKVPDVWTNPPALRETLQEQFGRFPLFKFWGPGTSIDCTRWITSAAIRVDERHDPTLTLVYLPHLDYGLQKHGPASPRMAGDLREVDAEAGRLIDHFRGRGARVIVLSEYGIVPVSRPVHLNRIFREAGLVSVRIEEGLERADVGQSRAFAAADHQVAHVYVRDAADLPRVRGLVANAPGVARVLEGDARRAAGLDHPRSGELVALAEPDSWFTYYYWLDDKLAPDYARTVDIHRKPGYDPVELFFDPNKPLIKAQLATKLFRRKLLNMRTPLDVIPLDATLVKGSHGVVTTPESGPLVMSDAEDFIDRKRVRSTDLHDLILRHIFGKTR